MSLCVKWYQRERERWSPGISEQNIGIDNNKSHKSSKSRTCAIITIDFSLIFRYIHSKKKTVNSLCMSHYWVVNLVFVYVSFMSVHHPSIVTETHMRKSRLTFVLVVYVDFHKAINYLVSAPPRTRSFARSIARARTRTLCYIRAHMCQVSREPVTMENIKLL